MTRAQPKTGSITVVCGSMFSGKTDELIRLVRRAMHARKKVQVFKSALDTRSETSVICTHDGVSFNATAVRSTAELSSLIEHDTRVVGIEEVQFLDPAVVALCQHLADADIEVIAAGLDQDFRGLPFGFMPELIALADNVLKVRAICKVCGREASRTQRLVDGRPAGWDEPTILIGAEESYEARCRHCHQIRRPAEVLRALPPVFAPPSPASGRAQKIDPQLRTRGAKPRGQGAAPAVIEGVPAGQRIQLELFPEIDIPNR